MVGRLHAEAGGGARHRGGGGDQLARGGADRDVAGRRLENLTEERRRSRDAHITLRDATVVKMINLETVIL